MYVYYGLETRTTFKRAYYHDRIGAKFGLQSLDPCTGSRIDSSECMPQPHLAALLVPLDVEHLIIMPQPAFAVLDEANPVNS